MNKNKNGRADNMRFTTDVYFKHKPITNIVDKIRAATAKRQILTNVWVTVQIAKDLLTLNKKNRPVSVADVDESAVRMREGNHIFTGDPVKITKSFLLVDKQHTLLAIIQSGEPQAMHIQCGLDNEVYAVLDSGRKRSGGDTMAVLGFSNYTVLAQAIKAEEYFRLYGKVGSIVHSKRITNQSILEWTKTEDIDLMKNCVDYSINTLWPKARFLNQSTWAWVYYMLSSTKGGRKDATEFMSRLSNGISIGPSKNSQIYLLREKLLSFTNERNDTGRKASFSKLYLIITAWNAYRNSIALHELVVDRKATELPKPI